MDEDGEDPIECGYCYAENDAAAYECWECGETLNN